MQAAPALPLQIVDFNGDYLNDIILVTHDGLYGWAQVWPPPSLIKATASLRMVAHIICQVPLALGGDGEEVLDPTAAHDCCCETRGLIDLSLH